jgi:hypothetical protein
VVAHAVVAIVLIAGLAIVTREFDAWWQVAAGVLAIECVRSWSKYPTVIGMAVIIAAHRPDAAQQ